MSSYPIANANHLFVNKSYLFSLCSPSAASWLGVFFMGFVTLLFLNFMPFSNCYIFGIVAMLLAQILCFWCNCHTFDANCAFSCHLFFFSFFFSWANLATPAFSMLDSAHSFSKKLPFKMVDWIKKMAPTNFLHHVPIQMESEKSQKCGRDMDLLPHSVSLVFGLWLKKELITLPCS